MNFGRDEFLTKAMGHEWHTCHSDPECWYCEECAKNKYKTNSFSTWEGYGELRKWALNQGWFPTFIASRSGHPWTRFSGCVEPSFLIDPDNFANAIFDFIKRMQI